MFYTGILADLSYLDHGELRAGKGLCRADCLSLSYVGVDVLLHCCLHTSRVQVPDTSPAGSTINQRRCQP